MQDMKNRRNASENLSVDEEDTIARAQRRKSRSAPTFQHYLLMVLLLMGLCACGLFHYRQLPKKSMQRLRYLLLSSLPTLQPLLRYHCTRHRAAPKRCLSAWDRIISSTKQSLPVDLAKAKRQFEIQPHRAWCLRAT